MSSEARRGPLSNFRVLDLGTFIAAPFCGTLLAEFGADVIKVEAPNAGDSLRTVGDEVGGTGLLWLQESRNKRTITCDLRSAEGQEIVRELVAAGYDIVLENFRPGTLERWHLGYDELSRINLEVILARVSAYGQSGPFRSKPGFGRVAQAYGCLTYLCGFPDRPPANPGSATLADYLSGLFLVYGVMVANEHRRSTGRGQEIDVALYESIFRVLDSLAITYAMTGQVRERIGSATPLAAPHNHYPTRDGKWVAIACTNDRIFSRLTAVMGTPGLSSDSRFATARARRAARRQLDELVSAWTSRQILSDLRAALDAAEVPSSPINSIEDAFRDPQYIARRTIESYAHQSLGPVRMPAPVPRLSDSPATINSLGRELGEDTDDVLTEILNYSSSQLRDLRDRGAI